MTPMSIRYGKGLSIFVLVVGVLLLVASLLATRWIGVFAGGVMTLGGSLILVNPMVRIEANEVQLRSPLGVIGKRFPVSSSGDLRMDGKSLRFVPTGKKISSIGFGVDKGDVDRLRAQISDSTT